MPSWNIHTAHVERLLREEGADALGIRDVNAFLVGNFIPDTYVGYMVPTMTHRIDYKMTHLAPRNHIPVPDHELFWEFYVARFDEVSDVTLGAWAHLVCDHVYNAHTRDYLEKIGLKPGERARIGKQADFATFGRTLPIELKPYVDEELVRQCAAFPQYSVDEADVRGTVEAACRIVEQNQEQFIAGEPSYQLLTAEFFSTARDEAHQTIVDGLRGRVAGQAR